MRQTNPDALPQLIGEFRPVDEWQMHINRLFYGLRGSRLGDYYQTFAAADYRLAHALAADYYEQVVKREKTRYASRVTRGPPSLLWNGAAATGIWLPASSIISNGWTRAARSIPGCATS